MDLLPTFARLASAPLPPQPIDGHDVSDILFGKAGAHSPWDDEGFMYYRMEQLQAVRAGPWKLYLPLEAKFIANNRRTAPSKLELYNVRDDVGETRELSAEHPDIVRRLTELAEAAQIEIARAQRPAGHVANPKPLLP
jgi:arylsulfatase A-like enzyme